MGRSITQNAHLRPPTTLVGGTYQASGANPALSLSVNDSPGTYTLTGTLDGANYPGTPQINITGAGQVAFLAVGTVDTTSRQLTVKVVVDGATVWEDQTAAMTTTDQGPIIIGGGTTTALDKWFGGAVPFNSSFQVYVKSTVAETDKSYIKLAGYYS